MSRYVCHQSNANSCEWNCAHASVSVKIGTMKVKLHVTIFMKTKDAHIWFWGMRLLLPQTWRWKISTGNDPFYMTHSAQIGGWYTPIFKNKDDQDGWAFRKERGAPPTAVKLMGSLLFYLVSGTNHLPIIPGDSPPQRYFSSNPSHPHCRCRHDRRFLPHIYGGHRYLP